MIATPSRSRLKRFGPWMLGALSIGAVLGGAWLLVDEARTSSRQAEWLSALAPDLWFELRPGPNADLRYPKAGPADERLGYARLPEFVQRLKTQGYTVAQQARMSPRMVELVDNGLYAPYREATQGGLELQDCRGEPTYTARYPERIFQRFEALPPLLVDALLFIENRELLDPRFPMRNPAVEWDRFGKAVVDQGLRRVIDSHTAAGGSTLATQIEKFRHSPEGRTSSGEEKLRQMASASVRAYLDGETTLPRRRQIVLDYLNTVPLSAKAGFGEVNGIGDGLWAWYGRDFNEAQKLLANPAGTKDQALVFKQALSLMVAQRRPSYYLAEGEPDLRQLTDSYVRLMADAGLVSTALRDAALALPLQLQTRQSVARSESFVDRKAATLVRTRLQAQLALPRAYDLDRLDLVAQSPLDGRMQKAATELLRSLSTSEGARAAGLYGFHLLSDTQDPARINYSFTLYERAEHANLLRVQTDNFNQPFDINEGARLDLGSTSKLRTLVTYLEMVADLHRRWAELPPDELAALKVGGRDAIGHWARDHLAHADDKSLAHMLDEAMERVYSANPAEGFFTGGGLHHFDNFDKADDSRSVTVREALTRSVNLPFIRLMRDLVRHVQARSEADYGALVDDLSEPRRREYLSRFADKEGREFLARFYRRFAGKTATEIETLLLQDRRATPARLAATLYGLDPTADAARLRAFIAQRLPDVELTDTALEALHEKYGADRWSLADRGYLAGLHPLELWVAAYLRKQPGASLADAAAASTDERQQVYEWLFKTRSKGAQDSRIRNLMELDAFVEIHQSWRRLGYPFDALTPSYASALGASGDRPAALAELMGIIVNGGLRMPVTRIESMQFARGTPYETRLARQPAEAVRVLPVEVTDVLRRALVGVVEDGTAKRLKGALARPDGSAVDIGGKTGTGDQRFDTYARGGRLISSRVVNRTATLVFLIGERHFGTMMAYVPEPYAVDYKFTSALPSQLLKALLPALQPLVEGGACTKTSDERTQVGSLAPLKR